MQKKCHILPSFFHKTLDEEGGRGGIVVNGRWKRTQDHFYATHIYCHDCENNIFNKYGENPVSNEYRKNSKPCFDTQNPIMHLAVSICFRTAHCFQNLHPEFDLSGPIRHWRRLLLNGGKTSLLLYRAGCLTYDSRGELPYWQSVARDIMFFDLVEHYGMQLIIANVPGMVFFGIVGNKGYVEINTLLDNDRETAKMIASVVEDKVKEYIDKLPTSPPKWQAISQPAPWLQPYNPRPF